MPQRSGSDTNEAEASDFLPRGDNKNTQNTRHWLYGFHAVLAALHNPNRKIIEFLATAEGTARIRKDLPDAMPEIVDRRRLEQVLPHGAVHQGLALSVQALAPTALDQVLADASANAVLVVLDQVTDPQNIGATLRNAAAFGASALVLTTRHSTSVEATLAKAASGALEVLPVVRVANLARGLDQIKDAGFWCIGLADTAKKVLDQAPLDGRVALILGAEGKGLRRLTRAHCDMLVSLPTRPPITSINIASASAAALYEIARRRSKAVD